MNMAKCVLNARCIEIYKKNSTISRLQMSICMVVNPATARLYSAITIFVLWLKNKKKVFIISLSEDITISFAHLKINM